MSIAVYFKVGIAHVTTNNFTGSSTSTTIPRTANLSFGTQDSSTAVMPNWRTAVRIRTADPFCINIWTLTKILWASMIYRINKQPQQEGKPLRSGRKLTTRSDNVDTVIDSVGRSPYMSAAQRQSFGTRALMDVSFEL